MAGVAHGCLFFCRTKICFRQHVRRHIKIFECLQT